MRFLGLGPADTVPDANTIWTFRVALSRARIAIPAFGYGNHIGIDRRHPLIRWTVTDAARHDGALLPVLIDTNNTSGDVWADTAYRSKANESFLAWHLLHSQIHRKKPMPRRAARVNARKSAVRSAVDHVFPRQKRPMGLFIRTIGLDRATAKIGLFWKVRTHGDRGRLVANPPVPRSPKRAIRVRGVRLSSYQRVVRVTISGRSDCVASTDCALSAG
jgi:IS5 family transposase